jgi:hypothetical protein
MALLVALLYDKPLKNMLPPKFWKRITPPFAAVPLPTKDVNATQPDASLDIRVAHNNADHRSITATGFVNGMNDKGAICNVKIMSFDPALDLQKSKCRWSGIVSAGSRRSSFSTPVEPAVSCQQARRRIKSGFRWRSPDGNDVNVFPKPEP